MIIVIAMMKAKAGKEQAMETALRDILPKVQAEEGTLSYAVHRVRKEPQKFFIYEKYRDKAALVHHSSAPYFTELFAQLAPLLEGSPTIDICELLASIDEKSE